MTLDDLLCEQARLRRDSIAIIDAKRGVTLTYEQLEREVARAAQWWRGQGIVHGKAVLVFVPMSAELYVALLALFRIGAVALFLDPAAGRAHMERCCAMWAPDALLAIPKAHLMRLVTPALRRIPVKISAGGWLPLTKRWLAGSAREQPNQTAGVTAEDAALVTFTSGSTGAPKAAVRTHGFLLAQYRALRGNIDLRAGEVDLATLPIFALANLAAGLATVIPDVDLRRPGAVDAARVFVEIEKHGVTRITASPAFFERLIEHGRRTGRKLPELEKLYTGGAPVFPRLLEGLRELAPNARATAVYGSTEAEPIAHVESSEITPEDIAAMRAGKGLLAGLPVEEVRLAVVQDQWGTPLGVLTEDEFARRKVPAGEAGEIVVAGEHVLQGYLGECGDEETKFRVGNAVYHRAGDAGMLDERGRLWLLGRCAAKLQTSDGPVYPFGLECVAMSCPSVRRAALVECEGRRVMVLESENSEATMREIGDTLTTGAIEEIRFFEKIPLDARHNAKVDYPALRELMRKAKAP